MFKIIKLSIIFCLLFVQMASFVEREYSANSPISSCDTKFFFGLPLMPVQPSDKLLLLELKAHNGKSFHVIVGEHQPLYDGIVFDRLQSELHYRNVENVHMQDLQAKAKILLVSAKSLRPGDVIAGDQFLRFTVQRSVPVRVSPQALKNNIFKNNTYVLFSCDVPGLLPEASIMQGLFSSEHLRFFAFTTIATTAIFGTLNTAIFFAYTWWKQATLSKKEWIGNGFKLAALHGALFTEIAYLLIRFWYKHIDAQYAGQPAWKLLQEGKASIVRKSALATRLNALRDYETYIAHVRFAKDDEVTDQDDAWQLLFDENGNRVKNDVGASAYLCVTKHGVNTNEA